MTEQEKHGGDLAMMDYRDFAERLEYCYTNRDDVPHIKEFLKREYTWENVYKVLEPHFIK